MHWGKLGDPKAEQFADERLAEAAAKLGTLCRGKFHDRGTTLTLDFFR
jgi:hypothetical protein